MRYFKHIEDGYILAIGTGYGNTEISVDEYSTILKTIQDKPTPPEGKDYRLTESLEWEEFDKPPKEIDEEATAEDYQAALQDMGVKV